MESTKSSKVFHLTGRSPEGRSLLGEIAFSRDTVADAEKYWNAGNYVLAAKVPTDDLDQAFEETNSIDTAWFTDPFVKWSGKSKRSTSVGDIVELSDGRRFVCVNFGWRELDGD